MSREYRCNPEWGYMFQVKVVEPEGEIDYSDECPNTSYDTLALNLPDRCTKEEKVHKLVDLVRDSDPYALPDRHLVDQNEQCYYWSHRRPAPIFLPED